MAEEVRIGSNTWKIGEDIRIVGSKVINKDKLQSLFGAQWKTAHIDSRVNFWESGHHVNIGYRGPVSSLLLWKNMGRSTAFSEKEGMSTNRAEWSKSMLLLLAQRVVRMR